MILTNCAACAAPLAHDAPRCVRCETKALLRKTIPVARRVLGESHILTLRMRCIYTEVLYEDPAATLDDLREGVTRLEDVERTARRVLGGAHPLVQRYISLSLHIALNQLHNAVETLAETERTTRRLLGSAHPVTAGIEVALRDARAELSRARRRVRDRRASERSPRGPPLRPPPALAVDDGGLDADVDEVLAS